MEFQKIDGEVERVYFFPGGNSIYVKNVVGICVRPSGNHRLNTRGGEKLIVKAGWLAISIRADKWSL